MQMKNARVHRLMVVVMALVIALVMGVTTSGVAQASLVTFNFAGTLDLIGVPFAGSYSFEPTTPDRDPGVDVGSYAFNNFSIRFMGEDIRTITRPHVSGSVVLGGSSRTAYAVWANSFDGPPLNLPGLPNLPPLNFGISVEGTNLFTSDALLLQPPSLGGLGTNARFELQYQGAFESGFLTSLTLAPVPLPGALLLFGSGLLGLSGLDIYRRLRKPIKE